MRVHLRHLVDRERVVDASTAPRSQLVQRAQRFLECRQVRARCQRVQVSARDPRHDDDTETGGRDDSDRCPKLEGRVEEDQERTHEPGEDVQVEPRRHGTKGPRGQPASRQVEKIGEDQDRPHDPVPVPVETPGPERFVGAVFNSRFEVGQIELFA